MPPQRPPVNDWKPVDITQGINDWKPVQLPPQQPQPVYEDDPSWLQQFGESWINRPLTNLPTRIADIVAQPMMDIGERGNAWYSTPMLYGGAFLHNIGEGVSGLTSPMNVATAGTLGAAGALGRGAVSAGLTTTGRLGATELIGPMGRFAPMPVAAGRMATAGRLMSAPVAAGGIGHMAGAENLPELFMGGLEAVGGGMGMRYHVPGPLGAARAAGATRTTGLDPSAPPPPPDISTPPPPGTRLHGPQPFPELVSREQFTPEMRDYFRRMGNTVEGVNAEGYEFMGRPGAQSPIDTPTAPPPSVSAEPNIVARRDWTAPLIEEYTQKGYVRGGVLPDGRVYMIKPGTPAPTSGMDIPDAAPIEPVSDPAGQTRIHPDDVQFNNEEGFSLATHTLTKRMIQGLREDGWEMVGPTADGRTAFRAIDPESGSIDLGLLQLPITGPANILRRMTGPDLPDVPRGFESGPDVLGSQEMRVRSQLQNIGEARSRSSEAVDLGPQPTVESMAPQSVTRPEKIAARIRAAFQTLRSRGRLYNWTPEQMAIDPILQRVRADVTELENITNLQDAYSLHTRWHDEYFRASAAGDHANMLYADEMADLISHRLAELRGDSPITSAVSQRPPVSSEIGEFGTPEEARMYAATQSDQGWEAVPEQQLPPRQSAEAQAFTQPSEPPIRGPHEGQQVDPSTSDRQAIEAATTREQFNDLAIHWQEEWAYAEAIGDQAGMQHAHDMGELVNTRLIEVLDRESGTVHPDVQEINEASTESELIDLSNLWEDRLYEARNAGETDTIRHAEAMADMASERRQNERLPYSMNHWIADATDPAQLDAAEARLNILLERARTGGDTYTINRLIDAQGKLDVKRATLARLAGARDPVEFHEIASRVPPRRNPNARPTMRPTDLGEVPPSVPPPTGGIPPSGGGLPPELPPTGPTGGGKKPSWMREAYNFSRAITTTLDLSAPLRQGLPLIFTKEWRNSWSQMVAALKDEGAFQKTLSDLRARDLFQPKVVNGKVVKSFAEQAGIKLMDLSTNLSSREELLASNWVEKIPVFGRAARASNRAYTAFLNQLRADTFENLIKDAKRIHDTGTGGRNPETDLTFSKEIADFVNTATGRGPLRMHLPAVKGGYTLSDFKPHLKEFSLERHAKLFTDIVFSPRLMASRVRMLNPATYMMASPFVRKQYLKSLLAVASAWGTTAVLAKIAGADVGTDPNSADFGKIKIGNTRIDAAGGFQQYFVAAFKLVTGHTRSSGSGRDFELGKGYRADTRFTIAKRFLVNKLHPVAKFGIDLLDASEHQPFQIGDRTLQMFIPLIVQDTVELMKEDPKLLPLLGPIGLGMGTQTYESGEAISKFIPKKKDIVFGGGSWY